MAACSDGDSDFVVSGVLDGDFDVVDSLRVNDKLWAHTSSPLIARGGILIRIDLVAILAFEILLASDASDGRHVEKLISVVSSVGKPAATWASAEHIAKSDQEP